jgi:tripartite-type tricarboxylate transporter receptor subunit TctC
MKNWKWIAAALVAVFAIPLGAQAQGYPNKPVRLIVAFTPGSSVDIVGRIVAQKLSEIWGQPVVAENRPGAGGSIGSAAVAHADPDGYTLLVNSNAHCVNPAIYAKLPYDTLKDFTDISPLAIQPNVLTVRADKPYKTLQDLVNAAKANPGALNIGHAGIGSGTHLTTEKFIAASGIKVVEIPFKGTPEVIAAILAGDVEAYWAPASAAIGSIKNGKLRPLAVSTAKRSPQLPDVPAISETGLKGAEAPLWVGLWGPAGMPQEMVNKINADVHKALADPTVKERLVNGANDTMIMSPKEFTALIHSEIEDYSRVLKAAGVKPH